MNKSIDIKSNKQILNIIILGLTRFLKLVVLIIVLAILTLGFLFVLKPAYKNTVNVSDVVTEEKGKEYSDREAYLSKIKGLQAKYEKITASDMKKIESLAPHENAHEKIILLMEKIVSDNGFLLSSINFSAEDQAGSDNGAVIAEEGAPAGQAIASGVKKIKISMDITGTDYVGFKNILNIFENSARLFDIITLSFDGNGRKTKLEGYAYYMN